MTEPTTSDVLLGRGGQVEQAEEHELSCKGAVERRYRFGFKVFR